MKFPQFSVIYSRAKIKIVPHVFQFRSTLEDSLEAPLTKRSTSYSHETSKSEGSKIKFISRGAGSKNYEIKKDVTM